MLTDDKMNPAPDKDEVREAIEWLNRRLALAYSPIDARDAAAIKTLIAAASRAIELELAHEAVKHHLENNIRASRQPERATVDEIAKLFSYKEPLTIRSRTKAKQIRALYPNGLIVTEDK